MIDQTDQQLLSAIQTATGKKAKPQLRACLVECADAENTGSIGAEYVRRWAERAGARVDIIDPGKNAGGYDIELVSVHHCTDIRTLANLPKRGKLRLIGGHATLSNVRPLIPFADAVCIGEGETWIFESVQRLILDGRHEALKDMPGTILSSQWKAGEPIPPSNHEKPLPDNDPYLNRSGTLSARWYIEIARGCPFRCAYCELGHSMPYRWYSAEHIQRKLLLVDGKTTKINFFAPDEASHPDYPELMAMIKELGYRQAFGSYRIDQILRRGGINTQKEQLVRVGVDGLTEETRKRVNKPITNQKIVDFFRKMSDAGHVQFKMFMIFGYPWDRSDDFKEWSDLMRTVLSIPTKVNRWLRIKWTPFIPQPCTPLGKEPAPYRSDIAAKITRWHEMHKNIVKHPGWHVESDGMMGPASHGEQVRLVQGNELVALKGAKGWVHPAWR